MRVPMNRSGPGRRSAVVAAALCAVVVAGGCVDTSGGPVTDGAGPAPTGCARFAPYAGHSGTKVSLFARILSPASDALEKSWADFSRCTGIAIGYEGSADFDSQIGPRVDGGNAPDLAVVESPQLLDDLVRSTRKVVRPPAGTVANEQQWSAAWKQYGSVDGTFYAAPLGASMKSLVWYSPKVFAQYHFSVPKTWTEMTAIADRIAANGRKAWCGGIGAGTATGWPATDWLEEVVLSTFGGDVYDQWVSHRIPFDSPQIRQAMQTVQSWMLNEAWVNGGLGNVASLATTPWQDAGRPILTGDCAMMQFGSEYEPQWPAGTKIAPDGDVYAFYLPPVGAVHTPVEGTGDFVVAFADRPEVQAVQDYLSSADWAMSRVRVGSGWVSANRGVDANLYADPIDRLTATYLADPNATFRMDASDMMPAKVGSGQEWKSLTAWFAERTPIDQIVSDIDRAWPQ